MQPQISQMTPITRIIPPPVLSLPPDVTSGEREKIGEICVICGYEFSRQTFSVSRMDLPNFERPIHNTLAIKIIYPNLSDLSIILK
jgi:hypothetical protein